MTERTPLLELTDSAGRSLRAFPLITYVSFEVEELSWFGRLDPKSDTYFYEVNFCEESGQPLPPTTQWRQVVKIRVRTLARAVEAKVAVGIHHNGVRGDLTVAQVSRILVAWDAHHEGAKGPMRVES